MAKHKQHVPKSNKFTIPMDQTKRPCFLVVEMIKAGKTEKTFVDRKKKENKDRCRNYRNEE